MIKMFTLISVLCISVLQALNWGSDTTYVIGHKHPDTDATCSAVAYANLMDTLGYNCKPMVAGRINNETKFVLNSFGLPVPDVLNSASGKKIILVDNSEKAQAVDSIENAEILQIIDHHSLGTVTTKAPLLYNAMPVGSSCTVVYTCYKNYNIPISKPMAGIMLSAILSDTENLSSSIVTKLDSTVVKELLPLSGIEDVNAYYRQMSDSAASYYGYTDLEIARSDYKNDNSIEGCGIGVGVVNSHGSDNHTALLTRVRTALPELMEAEKRTMVFILVENKTDRYTDILFYGAGAKEAAEKAFGPATDGHIRINYIMARKKDFMPAIKAALR